MSKKPHLSSYRFITESNPQHPGIARVTFEDFPRHVQLSVDLEEWDRIDKSVRDSIGKYSSSKHKQ